MRISERPKMPRRNGQSGSALLLVLVLLVWLGVIVVSNSIALQHLKRELHLLEKRQIKKAESEWRIAWEEKGEEEAAPDRR